MDTFSEVYEYFIACFQFLLSQIGSLFDYITSHWILYVPILSILIIGIAYLVGWLILEAAPSASGTPLNNPNKFYSTKWAIIPDLFRLGIRKDKERIKAAETERERVRKLNEQIEVRQNLTKYVDEYFKNNPWSYRISIKGQTFFRPGWEKVNWKNGKKSYSSKDVSFDVDLAEKRANTIDFGTAKNRRRH